MSLCFSRPKSQSVPYFYKQKLAPAYHSNTHNTQSLVPNSVLVNISLAVKRQHDASNSSVGKHLIGDNLEFMGLVHYRHGKKSNDTQTQC